MCQSSASVVHELDVDLPPQSIAANDDDPTPEVGEQADLRSGVEPPSTVRDLVKKRRVRRPRRSGLRDLKDAVKIRTWRKSRWEARGGSSSGTLHQHPLSPSSPSKNPTETATDPRSKPLSETPITLLSKAVTKILKPANDNRRLASWDDAGDLTRGIYVNEALDEFGVPFAFSVNLGPEVIRGANDNVRGFLDYVKRRITRELGKVLGRAPAFWMVVETTENRKPHVHGGIALLHNDNLPAVRGALERAGGRWRSNGTDRQIDLEPTRHRDTWACYPFKRQGRTRRHLRELAGMAPDARVPVLSVTSDLRNAGKRRHALDRAKINQARKCARDARSAK